MTERLFQVVIIFPDTRRTKLNLPATSPDTIVWIGNQPDHQVSADLAIPIGVQIGDDDAIAIHYGGQMHLTQLRHAIELGGAEGLKVLVTMENAVAATLKLDASGLATMQAALAATDAAPPADAVYLAMRLPNGHSERYEILREATVVGRDNSADIVLPPILRFVSGRHFELRRSGNSYMITDLGSTNGTRVNDEPLAPNVPTALPTSSVIRIGDEHYGVSVGFTFFNPADEHSPLTGYTAVRDTALSLERIVIGRDPNATITLDAPTVLPRHAIVAGNPANGYEIMGAVSNAVILVNNEPITKATPVRKGDMIRIGPFLLSHDGDRIVQYDSQGYRLDVIGLSKDVKVNKGTRRILHDINFTVMPREFVALVGGSGAGKTTLLDALNGLRPANEGRVLVNGRDLYSDKSLLQGEMGYVPQYDILPLELRVEDALHYAAQLRLPVDTTSEERQRRITDALETVNMNTPAIRQTRIRDLSGGQRKRVSIAAELISDPKLLFLDEPTSGLDPGLEKKMMYTLRRMADEGRTIVLITHATSNIVQCDHVAFLSQGRLIFYGEPEEAQGFFAVDDFADIYEHIETRGDHWQQVFQHEQPVFYHRYVKGRQLAADHTEPAASSTTSAAVPTAGADLRGQFHQFSVLSARMLRQVMAKRLTVFVMLLVMPLVALLQVSSANEFGIVGDPAITDDPVAAAATLNENYIPTNESVIQIFGMALLAVIVGAFAGSHEILAERSIYLRERMINLKIIPYVASKFAVFAFFAMIQTILYLSIYRFGTRLTGLGVLLDNSFMEIWVTLFITVMVGVAIGLFISALSPNMNIALYMVLVVVFVQYLYAGAVRDTQASALTEVISFITPARWGLAAIGTSIGMNELAEATILCTTGSGEIVCHNQPLDTDTLFIWYGDSGGDLLLLWGFNLLLAVVFSVGTYFVLRRMDGREIRLA